MEKIQQPLKEINQINRNQPGLKLGKTEVPKNVPEEKNDTPLNEKVMSKEEELELKSITLNKPKELLSFNAVEHFQENINNTDKNNFGPITEKSYYCINCMHSECPLYNKDNNQKEHILIKREKCLFYEKNFFTAVESSINESLTYNQYKNGIKECLTNSINNIKNELDKLKEQKFDEIDKYFDETDKYLLQLKSRYIKVKESINGTLFRFELLTSI